MYSVFVSLQHRLIFIFYFRFLFKNHINIVFFKSNTTICIIVSFDIEFILQKYVLLGALYCIKSITFESYKYSRCPPVR